MMGPAGRQAGRCNRGDACGSWLFAWLEWILSLQHRADAVSVACLQSPKPIGRSWSYLACRIGRMVLIRQLSCCRTTSSVDMQAPRSRQDLLEGLLANALEGLSSKSAAGLPPPSRPARPASMKVGCKAS
jgi:hypothetical protein